jgi:hypothetical protein
VLPERSHSLTYVLYPLLAGEAVVLPKMVLTGTRPTQTQDANEILDRLLPKTIAVLPKQKSSEATSKRVNPAAGYYEVQETVTLNNLPFKAKSRVPLKAAS